MKKCNKCGIIVQDDFFTCPNCKGVSFTQTDIEDTSQKDDMSAIKSFTGSEFKGSSGAKSDHATELLILRVLQIVGSCLCLIGLFLPFIKVTFLGTVMQKPFNELATNDVYIFAVIAIVGLIFACLGKHLIPAIAGAIYGVVLYLDTYEYFENIRQSEYGSFASKGVGFYCMVGGIILMIVCGAVATYLKHKN